MSGSNDSGKHADCIESVPIFKGLSKEEMLEVALTTSARTYEKGDMIYMAGEKGGKLYVLHSGGVKITRLGASGREQVIRILGTGEFMGELSLLSSLPLTDNAQAIRTTTMCVIEGSKLKELMSKYTSIAFKIMDELSRRLERAENLVESISLNSAEQRLAHFLLTASAGKKELQLNMTKGDLASQLGMSQETLSRKLALFQDDGIIELAGQRKIVIVDREGLNLYESE